MPSTKFCVTSLQIVCDVTIERDELASFGVANFSLQWSVLPQPRPLSRIYGPRTTRYWNDLAWLIIGYWLEDYEISKKFQPKLESRIDAIHAKARPKPKPNAPVVDMLHETFGLNETDEARKDTYSCLCSLPGCKRRDRLHLLIPTAAVARQVLDRDSISIVGNDDKPIDPVTLRIIYEQYCPSSGKIQPPSTTADRVIRNKTAHPANDDPFDEIQCTPLLKRYLETVRGRYSRIRMPLPSGSEPSVPIERIRIPVPLEGVSEGSMIEANEDQRNIHARTVELDRLKPAHEVTAKYDLDQEISECRKVTIAGDPGSGKSTLLRYIAYNAAKLALSDPTCRIPIVLECRRFAADGVPSTMDEIISMGLKPRVINEKQQAELLEEIRERPNDGHILLLIDALDEIEERSRRDFCRLLVDLAHVCVSTPMLLTSRIVGMEAVQHILSAAFSNRTVSRLSPELKMKFVENLFATSVDAVLKNDLQRQLMHGDSAIVQLTDNVLMLALVSQVYQIDRKEFPRTKRGIIERAIDLMISRKQDLQHEPVTFNELVPHLEFLALRMRDSGKQRFLEPDVLDAFFSFRKHHKNEHSHKRPIASLLRSAISPIGVLAIADRRCDDEGLQQDDLQFTHQSFQEYLASRALRFNRGVIGIDHVSEIISSWAVSEREVELIGHRILEPVVASSWQETIRMYIADLPAARVDEAFHVLLPDCSTPLDDARARAIFALQCLADEPDVSPDTLIRVFDAAVNNLRDYDGVSKTLNSWADEALHSVGNSKFQTQLTAHLVTAFIACEGQQRLHIGRAFATCMPTIELTTPGAVENTVDALRSNELHVRVKAGLEWCNACYFSDGKLAHLSHDHKEAVKNVLLGCTTDESAMIVAALWAMCWFTGAKLALHDGGSSEIIRLDDRGLDVIRQLIADPLLPPEAFGYAALLAAHPETFQIVGFQKDWTYDIAVIADGGQPRWSLGTPVQCTDHKIVQPLVNRICDQSLPPDSMRHTCVALGRLGIFIPEMAETLGNIFLSGRFSDRERREAGLYLGFLATDAAKQHLLTDANVDGNDGYGMLYLLLVDDLRILEQQLLRADSEVQCYANVLAGSRDRIGGLTILKEHENSGNDKVADAVKIALTRRQKWDESE